MLTSDKKLIMPLISFIDETKVVKSARLDSFLIDLLSEELTASTIASRSFTSS